MAVYKHIMESGSQCGVVMPAAWQQRLKSSQKSATNTSTPQQLEPLRRGLDQTIENEIIPRLMMTHRQAAAKFDSEKSIDFSVTANEIEHFAAMTVTQGFGVSYVYIDSLRGRGASLQDILLKLLAPAAQYMGRLWEQDLCDFADVTVGLGCLQQLVLALGAECHFRTNPEFENRSILLSASPGEQHTFGIIMVAEFFHNAGWNVTTLTPKSNDQICKTVHKSRFDLIGISASGNEFVDNMPGLIRDLRSASRNKALRVMAGGNLFVTDPTLATQVGADATALNGREALHNASMLLDSIDYRCSEGLRNVTDKS